VTTAARRFEGSVAVVTGAGSGLGNAPDPSATERLVTSQTPIPGLPTPADVAGVVAFLLSAEAAWITGLTVPVDGGYHAT